MRPPLGAADDGDRLVDVKQDFAQTEQQMQLVLFLAELEEYAAADAFRAPRRPLSNLLYAQNARHAADEDVEVAREAVLGVVSFIRRAISFSGSVPRLRSMAILRPERSVSSRTSAISRTLPVLTSSAILSMMASIVVVYGISVTSIRFSFLSYAHFARTLNDPRPLRRSRASRLIVDQVAAGREVRRRHA